MDVGHFILIYTKNGSKAWVGWLTEEFPDDGDGVGWYFSVLNAKNKPSADEGLEEMLVTVINPCDPTQPSNQFTATVKPDVVP